MKKSVIVLLVLVLTFGFFNVRAETTEDIVWTEVLEEDGVNFSYDKFDKQWEYYGAYVKKYSDATFVWGIQVVGERNSKSKISGIYVYSWVRDEYNRESIYKIESMKVLIGDKIFTLPMQVGENSSYVWIAREDADRQFLVELMSAKEVSIKLDLGSNTFSMDLPGEDIEDIKTVARDIIKFRMFDYCDEEVMQNWHDSYPLTVE